MEKEFDRWNEKKKHLHERDFQDYIHEREVWWCALGINVGVEADGKHDNFERPVLVVRKFNKDSVLIVPLTSRVKENPYNIVYIHEGERFAAIVSKVRLISTKRLIRRIFSIDSNNFATIANALAGMITKRLPQEREPRRPHGHNV